ncbi:DNA ligase 1-like isoform X2 [Acropora muricata]
MLVGDIVSALWIPNGKYYDAKILKKGADKSELMKERMRLEKEKKNENKGVDPKVQQKRKHTEEDKENQKRKKKKHESTESAKEKEQNAKDKEEKRKKKEQEKERQRMMLEARRAQAINRWVTSTTTTADDDEVAIVNDLPNATFTPQPLRRNSSLNQPPMISAHTAYSSDRTPNTTPQSVQSTMQESLVTNLALPASSGGTKSRTPNSSVIATPESMQLKHRSSAANPRPPGAKTKRTCEPKRGLHFQSAIAEDSDDEIEEEEEGILEDADMSNSDCCKEQRMEIKALRKRLEKVHKRLNIALKAKTAAEIINNRPGAGVVDSTLATECKMVEVMEGSGVFWYPHQRAYCSAFKSWSGYINAAVDIFFSKETLAISNAKGKDKKGKNGEAHKPLTPIIIDALIGKVCSKFSKESPLPSQIIQKINMKCVEARRPQRVREQRLE